MEHSGFFSGSARFALGFAVGGGLEYALTDYVTVKAEYLFYDLGTLKIPLSATKPTGVGQGLIINASQRLDGNIFRVGLSYKPDWL
jgi:outer membrane immunogenic protein